MKYIHPTLLLFTCCLFISVEGFTQNEPSTRPAGINLTSVHDYSKELVFTDAFKQCRSWISHDVESGGPWSTGVDVPLNENGYPLEIPYDNGSDLPQSVRTLLLWELGTYTPLGKYRLKVTGTGKVSLSGGSSGSFNCPVDTLVEVTNGSIMLNIDLSQAEDPISDIKFIYPEYVDTYSEKTFRDDFLDFVSDFQTIRFMDWLRTNNSEVSNWQDRRLASWYSQGSDKGVAWEYIVELCNQSGKDPWICIPHLATDDYIKKLAMLLRDNLDPELKIYLEYSNELWNAQFQQNSDAADMAADAGYTGQRWELTWKYTAKRSADIFRIFEEEFGNSNRLIKVIPSQAANSWLTNQIVSFFEDPVYNPSGVQADAIAIAPYFGGSVANDIANNNEVASISIDEIISRLQESLSTSFNWMDDNMQVAEDHGLKLMAYEGGQHLVATGTNTNITELTEKLIAANRDPEMKNLYCSYLDYWYATTQADMFCIFSSHGTPSKYGSWAIKEFMEDFNAPKYQGINECVFSYNTDIVTSTFNQVKEESLAVFPNPSSSGNFSLNSSTSVKSMFTIDALGHKNPVKFMEETPGNYTFRIETKGIYLLSLIYENREERYKIVVE